MRARVGCFENDRFRVTTVYQDIGTNFNPAVGFVERNGIRQYFGPFAYKPRLRYIFRPNSDLFVIYNQTIGRGLEQPSCQFQVKLTYNFTWNK